MLFLDSEFSLDNSSLYEPNNKKKHFGEIVWLRPNQIFNSENYEIFYQDIDADDIL